ncbi:hypothetical protein C7Y44_17055 [Paenibacillus popilliae]|uniref:Uncharacterized protein n=1 Tax=Paenibacillus popilliae TaxID=78057 RepID=A0ABY3AMQ4_PAEPP|nr:hypothetical protein C7Y44_17055 [Paenibacillus sp. SDF0028]
MSSWYHPCSAAVHRSLFGNRPVLLQRLAAYSSRIRVTVELPSLLTQTSVPRNQRIGGAQFAFSRESRRGYSAMSAIDSHHPSTLFRLLHSVLVLVINC